MGKFYSLDLRERAVAAYLGGESCRSVGARFQIAPSTVVKWAALLKRQGDLKPGKVGGHRKRVLTPHRDFILARIQGHPASYSRQVDRSASAARRRGLSRRGVVLPQG